MTLAEEIEMHVRCGVDLLFLTGLLTMAAAPDLRAQLDVALASVQAKITAEQEREIEGKNRLRGDAPPKARGRR